MKTAFKLRYYPDADQERTLARWFGHARFVWNLGLEMRTKAYRRRGESVTGVDVQRRLTALKQDAFPWLAEAPVSCLQQALRDQDRAFENFFAGRARYPRVKRRRSAQSVRVTLDWRHTGKTNAWQCGQLVLPGLGHVRLRGRALPRARPKMATVRRDACGRYWVAFTVEMKQPPPVRAVFDSVGVDLGVHRLATTSRGEMYDNPRALARHADTLKKHQQRVARQVDGSNRQRKTKRHVARTHARIADCRREHCHRVSEAIARQSHVVCTESLAPAHLSKSAKGTKAAPGTNVAQKRGLNRALLDASLGELDRQIAYKCARDGHVHVKVDRWFASSKLCSACGVKNTTLALSHRTWTCAHCGAVHDRDWNAAENIEDEGLRVLAHPGTRHPEVTGKGPRAEHRAGAVRAAGGGSKGQPMPGTAAVSARITQTVHAPSGTA